MALDPTTASKAWSMELTFVPNNFDFPALPVSDDLDPQMQGGEMAGAGTFQGDGSVDLRSFLTGVYGSSVILAVVNFATALPRFGCIIIWYGAARL